MPDGQIRVLISAGLDRSVEASFGQVEKIAERTAKAVGKAMGGGSQTAARAADKSSRDIEKTWNKQLAEANKFAKAEDRIWLNSQKDRVRGEENAAREVARIAAKQSRNKEREAAKETRDAGRELEKQIQAEERAAKKIEAEHAKFASRVSQRSVRFMFPNPIGVFGAAARIGGDVLRGAGVDTSISSLIQRGVGIESASVALSNRGHIPGAGPNGQVVASGALAAEARAVGQQTAVNPEVLLAAGREFVGLTGDLDLWRKIMPQVAKQTAALGGDQEAAAKAAGEFAAHVGDIPNKEKAILDLMAVAAGQGKIGGMDFSDFAKYAAKAAAPAAQFVGDKAQNIGKLTALAEIAKMHGGASNAAIAFTGIASFASTLKKPARLKTIAALIGNTNGQFTDSTHSLLRDVNQIIKDIVVGASKDKNGRSGLASLTKAGAAVGDSRAMMAVTGLLNTFNEAGGGAKGLAAMNAELAKFDGAVMSATETERANAEQLATSKSQAELFNQSLEAITHGAMAELTPALIQLKEPAIELAHGFGQLIAWTASNPGAAITLAVGAAISRAFLEAGFRSLLEKAIVGMLAGEAGTAVGVAGGGASIAGGAGVAGGVALGTVAAVAAAAGGAGAALWNSYKLLTEISTDVNDPNAKPKNGGRGGSGTRSSWAWDAPSRASTPEEYDRAHGNAPQPFRADHYNPNQRDPLLQKLDPHELGSATAAALSGRILRVEVVNVVQTAGNDPPKVDPGGRSPAPGSRS